MIRALSILRRATRNYAPAVSLLLVLLGVWESAVRISDVAPYLVPAPSRVARAFLEVRGTLPGHLRTTAAEAALGLALSAVLGAGCAALLAWSTPLRRAAYPLLVISQNIPLVVVAPLLVVWFGFGMLPKVLVVTLMGFFPIVVATTDGLLRADHDLVELAHSYGAKRSQVLRSVLIPSALPAFFAGLQISAAYAVLGAVIAEWVGASSGLGLFITRSQTAFRVDRVFVAVTVIAALSIASFAAVHLAARLAMPWQHAGQGGAQEEVGR
ncbi:MAG: ABC transporter permease [Chloroflexi bacterium]|nr:ABC transporter permease [Chloroflexota bacterium]